MEFTEDGIEAGLETVTAEAEDAGTRADVFLAAKLGVSRSICKSFWRMGA